MPTSVINYLRPIRQPQRHHGQTDHGIKQINHGKVIGNIMGGGICNTCGNRILQEQGAFSSRRPVATEDLSSGKKVDLRPNTDTSRSSTIPQKKIKPQSEEEHEFYNQVLNSICARFGKDLANLQDFLLNVAIWSQFTSDCLWASSWLSKDLWTAHLTRHIFSSFARTYF